MLKDTEWLTINKILLELYTVDDMTTLEEKTLKVLRMMIPFTKGYYIVLDEHKQINREHTVFIGMDDSQVSKYLDCFYDQDYLQYLYEFSFETCVYQDTTILDETVRINTPFYQMYLKPLGIPYGCGIMLIRDGKVIAILNLFRGENFGDFTEKDLYILNVLKKHMENMLINTMKLNQKDEAVAVRFQYMKDEYGMTDRENEILKLISEGKSNSDICEELVVSLSTVKKHVYNIYLKTGVKSRTQLLNLLFHSA